MRALGNVRDGALVYSLLGGTLVGTLAIVLFKYLGLFDALALWSAPVIALSAWLPARWTWRRAFKREQQQLSQSVSDAAGALERRIAARRAAVTLSAPDERSA